MADEPHPPRPIPSGNESGPDLPSEEGEASQSAEVFEEPTGGFDGGVGGRSDSGDGPPRGKSRNFSGKNRKDDDLENDEGPITQVSHQCLFRGFDPASGVASFGVFQGGQMVELRAKLKKSNPLHHKIYGVLLAALEGDQRVPAMSVRLGIREDQGIADLLIAHPVANEREIRYRHKQMDLRWTESLDQAVDTDFEQSSAGFANSYLKGLSDPAADAAAAQRDFHDVRAEALVVFKAEAKSAGIGEDAAAYDAMFNTYACTNRHEVLFGTEVGGNRRYDVRYGFCQQAAHVPKEIEARCAALANYAMQVATCNVGARKAIGSVDFGDGRKGSLAEAHQHKLTHDHILLRPSPSLEQYGEIFQAYSYEAAFGKIAHQLSGAMDAAGIPPANGTIDAIEHEKKHTNPDKSAHAMALSDIPEEMRTKEFAPGAYLSAMGNRIDGFHTLSRPAVHEAQRNAIPLRDVKQPDRVKSSFAETFRGLLGEFERQVDTFGI